MRPLFGLLIFFGVPILFGMAMDDAGIQISMGWGMVLALAWTIGFLLFSAETQHSADTIKHISKGGKNGSA